MIMKKLICPLIAALAIVCVRAQTPAPSLPPWNATVKVLDETGVPVAGADVEMSYYVQPAPGQNEAGGNVHAMTDTNGVCLLSHSNTGSVGLAFQATKNGYYSTTRGHEFAQFKDSDPSKWNPSETLVLKAIGKPIAMYAKNITYIEFPTFNKPIGYDLMIGDWVAPYGKGISSDFLFTENHLDAKSGYTFTISFPKAGDGIQKFTPPDAEKGSGLRSPHEAPVDGYQPTHEQTQMPNPNKNYFFRVRTSLDENGNVVSAHYGKIYGDFMQFTYYLNPTPNSRNIEFDPKQNLIGGSPSSLRVQSP